MELTRARQETIGSDERLRIVRARDPLTLMESASTQQSVTAPAAAYDPRPWEKMRRDRAPRGISFGVGPQGKLILCFTFIVSAALGASCWMFATQTQEQLTQLGGEQAGQISSLLALSCEEAFANGRTHELRDVAQELIKNRSILFVAFLNTGAKPIVLASRDLDFRLERMEFTRQEMRELMKVRHMRSPVFGEYVEVLAPVFTKANATKTDSIASGQRLQGYVAVGVSQLRELAQVKRTTYLIVGIGCVAVIVSIPLAYWLVRLIFLPVRELVRATKKITAGDLDARVSTQRRDLIGELARSFNEMVIWVKQQQNDIAQANQKLAEANRDLEAKVVQRTAQVETALKRLSNEIAEKEEFLRAVSHDLNAPLRNISGMATMLLMKHKDKFDEDVVHRLERIKKNVDVETDLITELLELSRIKTRRQKMESVDLEALVWELRGLFENDLKSRAIELSVDSALPALHAERARIRQVFQNLVDNAIKYMGDGMHREIHIGCSLNEIEAEFYVRDTGIGIDPEDLDKVFFVFRRGKNTTAQNIAGKGVGLASVKSIIETYNGKIWVESKLGEGTTFRFTINGKHVPAICQTVPATNEATSEQQAPADVDSTQELAETVTIE